MEPDIVRSQTSDICSNLLNKGPKGWCVLAHPNGDLNWKFFPTTNLGWERSFDNHSSPSVIRSYADTNLDNNGYGVMGMEVATGRSFQGTDLAETWDMFHWAKYLHHDLPLTIYNWDTEPTICKNNFVFGMANSDSHCWEYLVEDLTAIKTLYYSSECKIANANDRKVPHFEDTYWYATFTTFMMGNCFTFVYLGMYDGYRTTLLNSLRSCGKEHGGISFSIYGSFVTFKAGNVSSGGLLDYDNSEDLKLSVTAYPLIENLGRITDIWIYRNGTDDDPYEEIGHFVYDLPFLENKELTLDKSIIRDSDYIFVKAGFKHGGRLKKKDFAIANPVIIK